MARILVLGYGNPLRSDDGVGWRVAEAIAVRWPGSLIVRTGQNVVPEWAVDLHDADAAYFVDASVDVEEPQLEPLPIDLDSPLMDGHDLTPAQLLRLTRTVYGLAPRAFVVHVPAVNFDFGETLTPVAACGVRGAVCLLNTALGLIL